MSFALPVERLVETDTLLAFHHPSPAYSLHIVLVPKKSIPSLSRLDPVGDRNFLVDLFTVTQKLVKDFELEEPGYRLIANGGPNQEFPILHFHLVSESTIAKGQS